ncbi:MAG: hypothetical protein RML56_02715 [Burkholderiales bacterium]|nr:hypothetical protein [Burkholderiales bacterium]
MPRTLDAEGAARAVLAGHCLGANLALFVEFAAREPARVAGLVLVEPMPREALAGKYALLARAAPLLRAAASLARAANALGLYRRRLAALGLAKRSAPRRRAALAAGPAARRLLRRYASPLADLETTPTAAYPPGARRDRGRRPAALGDPRADPRAASNSRRAFYRAPARARAHLVRAPDCAVVEIAARHWIPTERPAGMRAAIEDWIGRRFPCGL